MRESEEIGREIFANYEGQRLQVQGYFIEAQPYSPDGTISHRHSFINGDPLPRGSGFQVISITNLE